MTANGTLKDEPQIRISALSGNDIYWFLNGISFVIALYRDAGIEIKDWIDFREHQVHFAPEVGHMMLQGMAKAADAPMPMKIGCVVEFMLGMGIEIHMEDIKKRFDA